MSEGNKTSEGEWSKECIGRIVTHLNLIKGPNFILLITTTANQYKNYIQKCTACKECETIRTKPEKIDKKNEGESKYLQKRMSLSSRM